MSDDQDNEGDEGYNEFIEEYGRREDWCIYDWSYWDELFCTIKIYWKTKEVRRWREKALKQFVLYIVCPM